MMAQVLGWLAASLVLLSFSLKTMVALRTAAIASNVAFLVYGWAAGLVPVFVLHGLLLPMNLWRLHQMRDLLKRVRRVSAGDFQLTMLLPYMAQSRVSQGTRLFDEGDPVDTIYLILEGEVRVERIGAVVRAGELLGEMGVFTRTRQRTAGAVCATDVHMGTLSASKFWEVFYSDPAFGTFVMQTVVSRSVRNQSAAAAQPAGVSTG